MAYQVDWETKVITIPQSDLTHISGSIYKLDLELCHQELRRLEWEFNEGLSRPQILQYIPPLQAGGVIYARFVLLQNGYTITFEDGQYAVNFDGANTNIQDYTNVNQVSIRPNNSAGLQDLSTLLASAYQGKIVVDVNNLTGSSQAGTSTPIGTYGHPVNNIQDAVKIAVLQGIGELYIIGNLTLSAGDDVSNLKIVGSAPSLTFITVEDEAYTYKTQFINCTLAGILDGNSTLENGVVWDMAYFSGIMHNIAITDSIITLGGGADAIMLHCYAATAGGSIPTIDMGESGQSLTMGNYNGDIKITNKTGIDAIDIYLNAGKAIIDSTVTNGDINIYGGIVENNSTANVTHYKTNDPTEIATAVWNKQLP